jgi:quercetin dioxygenase-like cupin family protein
MNGIESRISPSSATHPFDAMAKAPDHHRVLLENDKVRVLDTKVAPGERTPVHAHEWAAALYVLSWSDFVRYDPDGNVLVDSRTMTVKPGVGAALWTNPIGPHFVENVGQADLHILAIETKPTI